MVSCHNVFFKERMWSGHRREREREREDDLNEGPLSPLLPYTSYCSLLLLAVLFLLQVALISRFKGTRFSPIDVPRIQEKETPPCRLSR